MENPLDFAGQAVAVWFIVMAIRGWFPAGWRGWLDGPARVWSLVYLAALVVLLVEAQAPWTDWSQYLKPALALAIGAVGTDNIQQHIPQLAGQLRLPLGPRRPEREAIE